MLWYWAIRAPTASSLAGLRNGGGWELDIVGVMVGLTGGPRWYVLVVVSRVYLYTVAQWKYAVSQIANSRRFAER